MNVKHLIGIYIGMLLAGLALAALWHDGAVAAYFIIKRNPSIAITSAITVPWLQCLSIFLGNLLVDSLLTVGLMLVWDWKATVPVLSLSVGTNGFILGVVGGMAALKYGALATVGALVTHGIPEMASHFIACGACIYGLVQLRAARGANLAAIVKRNMRVLLGTCIPLLLVAAVLETFVSPAILAAMT